MEKRMRDDQVDINGDICALNCALAALIGYAGLITPEDKTRLSRLYIQFGDLLSEIIKDKI